MNKFYTSGPWRKARERALRRDKGLCADCMRYGRKREAVLVHHVVPYEENPAKGLRLENLISLCEACHNKRHPEKGIPPGRRRGNPHNP